jgi:hypothetical protein
MGVAKIMIRGRRRMQKTIVTIILKMISTIAVIVLSPFGYFSRLPYCALMCCYLIERPKLSDPAHGTPRLQTTTPCRVRCSAWLGVIIV